jgi:hypothetical protein
MDDICQNTRSIKGQSKAKQKGQALCHHKMLLEAQKGFCLLGLTFVNFDPKQKVCRWES